MERRIFIKRCAKALLGMGVLTGLHAWKIAPYEVEFVQVPMFIPNLPNALIGSTLVQISDMHIGKRFNYQYIINSLKKVQAMEPDFVVYTGDYITLHKGAVQYNDLRTVLSDCAKGKLGTIGILGNHDYGINWKQPSVADAIAEQLNKYAIQVLRNEQTQIAGLNFIGLDDYWGTNFAPAEVMNTYDASQANIVLCHNPDVCDLDIWNGYNSWILSGHTHGGQVTPPFLKAPIVPVQNKNYTAGKFNLSANRTLYINRAIGHMYPFRFNTPPEITIFTLQKA